MKTIIFGVSGTVGKALTSTLTGNHHEVYGSYHLRKPSFLPADRVIQLPVEELDLLDKFLTQVNPDFVIMALRGDFEKQLKFHVHIAEHLRNKGGRMIFCSTSNVFDASTDSPHYEEDPPNAASDYGQYKVECEKVMAEMLHDNLTIVRIPTVFGHDTPRTNELRQQLKEGMPIKIYTNFYSTRNTDHLLSKQIAYLMEQKRSGIFHLGTTDIMVHSEFMKKLVTRWGYTDVTFEELQRETFSSAIPKRYDNSLLSNHPLPQELQHNHEQLIEYLS
jgi:dTDP-4-dehydrorhamnose reductase